MELFYTSVPTARNKIKRSPVTVPDRALIHTLGVIAGNRLLMMRRIREAIGERNVEGID